MNQDPHAVGRTLLNAGEALAAYDHMVVALAASPGDRRLQELEARALLQIGARRDAKHILLALRGRDRRSRTRGPHTEEVLGLLASAAKRAGHLRRALTLYRAAYNLSRGYWTGINVATLAASLGFDAEARAVATEIVRKVLPVLEKTDPDDAETRLWVLGTLGEAALVLGDAKTALARYLDVRKIADAAGAWVQLQSVRQNANRLLELGRVERAPFDALLTPPPVAICVGHMLDRPGERERFPLENVDAVEAALEAVVERYGVRVGISSMAQGADLLFQKVMDRRHGRRHVVLPFGADRFQVTSVKREGDTSWASLFDSLLRGAHDTREASQHEFLWGGLCYDFANGVLYGRALMLADQIGASVLRIAVYDGQPGKGPGGTHTVVRRWLEAADDGPIEVVPPLTPDTWDGAGLRLGTDERPGEADDEAGPVCEGDRRVMAVIFADARGFSGFTEDQNNAFVSEFLGAVREIIEAEYADDVFFANTWGDGLYFALPDIERAGHLALDLRDVPRTFSERLREHDLGEIRMRIAVHAGPVTVVTDPVTGRVRVTGTHLSQAARTEPETPEGQVYASEPFAALSRAYRPAGAARTCGARGYACRYVGRIDLAKGFGAFPTYVVDRTAD